MSDVRYPAGDVPPIFDGFVLDIEHQGEDAHEGSVALRPLIFRSGALSRMFPCDAIDRIARGIADVEHLAVRSPMTVIKPSHEALSDILAVEASGQ